MRPGTAQSANFGKLWFNSLNVVPFLLLNPVQRAERIDTSLEELYQAVENLCSHGKAEQVYANLRDLVEAHVQVLFTPEIQGGPSGRITQFVALKLKVPTQCKVLKVKPNSYFIVNKSFFSTRWTSL